MSTQHPARRSGRSSRLWPRPGASAPRPGRGHHHACGQQAPGADGGAHRRGAAQPHDAAHEPDSRRRAVPRARATHPRRDRRHGADAGRVEGHAQRPAAGQRDAGVRAQSRRAGHFPVRAQVPASGRAAAAVGGPAAVDGGRLRCLHPLRRAAGCTHHRAPHRAQPPAAVRVTRPTSPSHGEPEGSCRPGASQLHQHPAGGRGVRRCWRLARGRGANAAEA